jgi:electron transfer flavoprotein alpha subunit
MSSFPVRDPRALHALLRKPSSSPRDDLGNTEERPLRVLACPDALGGRLSSWDRRILGTARRLADGMASDVLLIARNVMSDDVGSAGADALTMVDEHLSIEEGVDVLCELLESHSATHIIFPDSDVGGDYGRRLAARVGDRANARVWRIRDNRATCLTGWDGGEYERELSRVLLLADGAEAPYTGVKRRVRDVRLGERNPAQKPRMQVAREWRLSPDEVDLQDAELVVGGGLGIKSWTALKEVAGNLGASFGASRPVVDKGILPRSFQIGATGALLNARCYIALGISGAPQHLEGLKRCDFVVGVNLDNDCPMAQRADLFIQADADDVLAELGELARSTA